MENSKPIRVLIVDDHSMVRKGLAAFLKNQPGLVVTGEARDGGEAVELCDLLKRM
jgi:DNA-binding NarL/FixJ family response regulator